MESSLPAGTLNLTGQEAASNAGKHLAGRGEFIRHLYLHLPFCERICPYCDFSKAVGAGGNVKSFLEALRREGEILEDAGITGRLCTEGGTLYLGGGTPSWFEPEVLEGLLDWISSLNGGGWAEATVEMNPEHGEGEKLRVLKEGGINRLSLGVQSLNPEILRRLGRVHSARQASEAAGAALEMGFVVSIDLIFSVPGQELASWYADVEEVLRLKPHHISLYNLTFEPGTTFSRWLETGKIKIHDEEWQADAYEGACMRLADAGFRRYEVSNFALPGYTSIHNQAYWSGESYLGLGPSAHTLLGRIRIANEFDLSRWEEALIKDGRPPWESVEELDDLAVVRERVLLGLRTSSGVSRDLIPDTFRESFLARADEMEKQDLVAWKGSDLVLTEKGILLADEIAVRLSP